MVTTADGGAHIPTPPILVVPSYHDRMNYGKFVQPSFYIKAHQSQYKIYVCQWSSAAAEFGLHRNLTCSFFFVVSLVCVL